MIAAAGLGSRLGHGLPKCMVEIGGQTILSRLIESVAGISDRVHVVVGYREELVIDHLSTHHRHVVIARNPQFRTTNTIASMRLGARGLDGPLLFLDGDMVLRPGSLERLVSASAGREITIGVTPATTDDGVYVVVDESDGAVREFRRSPATPVEWANVMVAPASVLDGHEGFVYEAIQGRLPLPAVRIEMAEVDTEDDLARARAAVETWESPAQ